MFGIAILKVYNQLHKIAMQELETWALFFSDYKCILKYMKFAIGSKGSSVICFSKEIVQ